MLTSKPVESWNYLLAPAGSAAAQHLAETEKEIDRLADRLGEIRQALTDKLQAEVVAITPERDPTGITGFAIVSERNPGKQWEAIGGNIYKAQSGSPFDVAQAALLKRYRDVLDPAKLSAGEERGNPVWAATRFSDMIGARDKSGAAVSDPHRGILVYRPRPSVLNRVAKRESIPRRDQIFAAEATRLEDGWWLFKVPVNPDDGAYFHPPGARLLDNREKAEILSNTGHGPKFNASERLLRGMRVLHAAL